MFDKEILSPKCHAQLLKFMLMSNSSFHTLTDPEYVAQQMRNLEGKEPTPREVAETIAYFERIEQRERGDWSDFQYKFQLDPDHEQIIREFCLKHGLNFEAEWCHFNDTRTVSSATTYAEKRAERQWSIRRVQPTSLDVYLRFKEALQVRVTVGDIGRSHPSDVYSDAPVN